MENKTTRASNFDELLMHHSLLFSDSLKDLRSLSNQLYSAAEHFELSYSKQNQQQLILGTLKDYVSNAIVNTVDHLGSVANKLNEFLDEKFDEVSTTKLHLSCLEQRLRTSQNFIESSGFSEESYLVKTPKYYKQYIIPEKKQDIEQYRPLVKQDAIPSRNGTKVKLHPPLHSNRKGHTILPSMNFPSRKTFSFSNVSPEAEKTLVSPLCFSLKREGSFNGRPQVEKRIRKEIQPYPKKSKPVFKALLTMYKQKIDGRL